MSLPLPRSWLLMGGVSHDSSRPCGTVPAELMFRIRQSYREDVEQVLAVAEHLDTVNLPAERGHIEGILDRSEKAFAAEVPVAEREFVFVLEDLAKKKIIG